MSIKVYDGYRTDNLELMLKEIKRLGKPLIEEAIDKEVMSYFRTKYFKTEAEIDEFLSGTKDTKRFTVFSKIVHNMQDEFRKQRNSSERNSFDFSLGLNIYLNKGTTGFYPWKGDGLAQHFDWANLLILIDGVFEYAYWNNTDPDEKCPKEEWKARKEFWDYDTLDGPMLRYELLSPDNFFFFIPKRERIDAIASEIPDLAEKARYGLRANAVLSNDRGLGKDACFEKFAELARKAGEQPSRWIFDWLFDSLERNAPKADKTQGNDESA